MRGIDLGAVDALLRQPYTGATWLRRKRCRVIKAKVMERDMRTAAEIGESGRTRLSRG